MKIAVMGAGGVGGYFGGLLAAGNEVSFVARGAHLAAIRESGLKLDGPDGIIDVRHKAATDEPGEIGPVDVVIFAVKLYDTETAAEAIRPVVGPDTRVLSLQNGVDGGARLARVFGAERVWAGPAYIASYISAPGRVRYFAGMSSIRYGTWTRQADPLAGTFLAACQAAGFGAELVPDARVPLWEKFILLATNSALSAATRGPTVRAYQDPEMQETALAAFREVEAVARAEGIGVAEDIVQRCLALSGTFAPDSRASMCNDLLNGRRMELDSLSGLVVRLGETHGIETPVHRTLYTMLKPFRDGPPPP